MPIISGGGGGSGVTQAYVDAAVGGVPWTDVTKAADQSISSNTTLTNDTELFFTATSGKSYELEIAVIYATPTPVGQDIKFDLGEDATARGMTIDQLVTTAGAQFTGIFSLAQTLGTAGGVAANRELWFRGWYVGGGGVFRFRWAQNASSANATIVRAGSVIRYRLLG